MPAYSRVEYCSYLYLRKPQSYIQSWYLQERMCGAWLSDSARRARDFIADVCRRVLYKQNEVHTYTSAFESNYILIVRSLSNGCVYKISTPATCGFRRLKRRVTNRFASFRVKCIPIATAMCARFSTWRLIISSVKEFAEIPYPFSFPFPRPFDGDISHISILIQIICNERKCASMQCARIAESDAGRQLSRTRWFLGAERQSRSYCHDKFSYVAWYSMNINYKHEYAINIKRSQQYFSNWAITKIKIRPNQSSQFQSS